MCIYIYIARERFVFKELARAIIGIGKFKICRAGQQTRDLRKG